MEASLPEKHDMRWHALIARMRPSSTKESCHDHHDRSRRGEAGIARHFAGEEVIGGRCEHAHLAADDRGRAKIREGQHEGQERARTDRRKDERQRDAEKTPPGPRAQALRSLLDRGIDRGEAARRQQEYERIKLEAEDEDDAEIAVDRRQLDA